MSVTRKTAKQIIQEHSSVMNEPEEGEGSLVFSFEPSQERKEKKSLLRVSFQSKVRVKWTTHLNDFTDEEYYDCWYTPEELADMKGDLIDTLQRLERQEKVDEVNDTFRGLETHTKAGRRNKGRNRTTAIEAVIGLYYRESTSQNGKLDAKEVADAYKECNKPSELAAYLSGIGDQGTVRDLDMSFNTESIRQRKGVRRCGFSLIPSC